MVLEPSYFSLKKLHIGAIRPDFVRVMGWPDLNVTHLNADVFEQQFGACVA
jgi:hypothetical protein